MRKVYQVEKSSTGLIAAVAISLSITAVIFCIIPFSHLVNKPSRTLELRKTSAADMPPPKEDENHQQEQEKEKPPEAPPQPQLADAPQQQIQISADLEVATGSGGALAGFGDIQKLTAAQTITEQTFDASELEKRPEAVSQVPPSYPSELAKAKIEGMVTLVFILNEDGKVEEPRVENSSRPEFEKPALDAIKRWRFRPGMKDGQAVRSYIRIPMRFRVSTG